MATIDELARAVLDGNALLARSLAQDFIRNNPVLTAVKSPAVSDARVLAASAALLELFALRSNQPAPLWTSVVGGTGSPVYLVKAALTMKRLRALCDAESPLPLRKRGFYAPPDYLVFG
jgi:hypothetical protein